MGKKYLEHEDAMELAVQLTCSYLSTSHSGSTRAEDLILDYYQQIRNVEARLHSGTIAAAERLEHDQEEAEEAMEVAA